MMATHLATHTPVSIPDLDLSLLDQIIDKCFEKMRDDYRVNRFFNGKSLPEQTKPLKALVRKVLQGAKVKEHLDVLDDFFAAAFARGNAKPALVTGNDFAFLLDVIGGQDIQVITPLCICHGFLLKLGPGDDHYDILLEHLSAAMKDLQVGKELSRQLLDIAASGREGALGRLPPIN